MHNQLNMHNFIKTILTAFIIITVIVNTSCSNIKRQETTIIAVTNKIYISTDWGSETIDFEVSNTEKVKIGIIDSSNNYASDNIECYSTVKTNAENSFGHGSYTTAIMSSLLPKSNILSINAANEKGEITEETLCDSIKYAIEKNCDIINMSLGTQCNYPELESIIKYAVERGIIIIAASGNNFKKTLDYPAAYKDVISVISRNIDNIDVKSNNVSLLKKSFSAPDSIVFNENIIVDGSSVATVYATAVVASIKAQLPQSNISEINNLLKKTSVFSTDYSYGMINYKRIVNTINKGDFTNGQ